MTLLLQCVFYFCYNLFNLFAINMVEYVSQPLGYILLVSSFLLFVATIFSIVVTKAKFIKYLDLPLIFISAFIRAISFCFLENVSILSIITLIISYIASIICGIRVIICVVSFFKEKRDIHRKSAIIISSYVFLTLCAVGFNFIDFDAIKYSKPNQNDIDLLNECYYYTENYLEVLPTDSKRIRDIYEVTDNVIQNEVFFKAYSKSEYHNDSEKNFLKNFNSVKSNEKQLSYAEIVALHLKTLAILEKDIEYNEFFKSNCNILIYPGNMFYLECWKTENPSLKEENTLKTILTGYENILTLCDNDIDIIKILNSIINFCDAFDSTNTQTYYKQREEIESRYDDLYEDLYDDVLEHKTYSSKAILELQE